MSSWFLLGLVAAGIFEIIAIWFLRFLGFYIIVREGTCFVYVLFGKVVLVVDEPGIHFLWPKITWRALVMTVLGNVYRLDMRLDQEYLRSQPVNSEEGAPMGIGIWYEMFISDPLAYLFKNADPRGSLSANVSNATVRCLSNMPLTEMLENRHGMSRTVRREVTEKSADWGYKVGSVYVRKVHFRDSEMIRQIESKVVNRLRQVTAAIKQHGENQVNIITSGAESVAAVEFAKAAAIRPRILGEALSNISKDKEVAAALFEVLECQRILESSAKVTLLSGKTAILGEILAARADTAPAHTTLSSDRKW